jgi:opacity protein-like surface antigen
MAGASFNYEVWRNLMLTLDYQYTTTQSNTVLAPFTEFTDNRYTAGLTYKY